MSNKTAVRMWIVRTSVNGYANRDFVDLYVNKQPARVAAWMNDHERLGRIRIVEEYVWTGNEWHESTSVTFPPYFAARVRNGGIGVV